MTHNRWLAAHFGHEQSSRDIEDDEHARVRGGHLLHDVHPSSDRQVSHSNMYDHAMLAPRQRRHSQGDREKAW